MEDVIAISSSSDEEEAPSKKPLAAVITSESPCKKMKLSDDEVVLLSDGEENGNMLKDLYTVKEAAEVSTVEIEEPSKENVSEDGKSSEDGPMEIPEFFKKFIDACIEAVKDPVTNTKMINKSASVYRIFRKTHKYSYSDEFKLVIDDYSVKLQANPSRSIHFFLDVFQHLQDVYKNKPSLNKEFLPKLYKLLDKLDKIIQTLEQQDVDFDDEDDSSYLKMQRYRERANKVYLKIKEMQKCDPYSVRMYYSRLDYANSKYTEINRAINKKFQSRLKIVFPTFDDVDKCIRKCVAANPHLALTESQICAEVRANFEELGNLIQRKRRQDIAQIHHESYVATTADPAASDPELEAKLKENKKFADKRTCEMFQRYTEAKPPADVEELSEDSDDSHKATTDEENDDEEECA